jgi:hypothetical protein
MFIGQPVRDPERGNGDQCHQQPPRFVAGIYGDRNGIIVRAAPIVSYLRGWDLVRVRDYVRSRHWQIEGVSTQRMVCVSFPDPTPG